MSEVETRGTEGTCFTVQMKYAKRDNWLIQGIKEIRKELKSWPKWKRTTKPVPHD